MRFAFTDDQQEFAEAFRDVLLNEAGPELLRASWDDGTGRIPGLWAQLAGLGVVGLLAPEGVGGFGLAEIDLVLLLAEAGRAGLPEPLADVAAVAVPAIRDHAQADDAVALLERIVAGTATVAVGLATDAYVLHAAGAAAYLLEADDGLHLVDPDVVELTPVRSVDSSRRLSAVSWTPSDATRIGGGVVAAQQARDRAAVAAAAELCGLADTAIRLTVEYVSERRQFGVPIGSFQAIKHHLANALLAIEFAKPLVWRAAYSISQGDPDSSLHVSMAKAKASVAAQLVADVSLQCHGAIGYTVEHDLHLFIKRIWALSRHAGDAAFHRRRVGGLVLG